MSKRKLIPNTMVEKQEVTHTCYQEKAIGEIHKIVVGNGDPDKSLCRQVALINERQGFMMKTMDAVQSAIKDLDGKYEKTIEASTGAVHAVERYHAEMEGAEKGKDKVEKKRQDLTSTWINLGMLILTAVAVYLTIHSMFIKIESRIDNLGEPVVTNGRGKMIPLPADAKIQYFPKDFDSNKIDTTKK